jgi:hypothetical protein
VLNTGIIKYYFKEFLILLKKKDFKNIVKKIYFILIKKSKIDLDYLNIEEKSLNSLFNRFGSDKGTFDTKKTFERIKKNHIKFKNYLDWIKREKNINYEYQMGNGYSIFYDKYFLKKKNQRNNILEIGVANGHSSASFYKYFLNSKINCLDNKPIQRFFYKGERLKYFKLDIFNEKNIKKFLLKSEKFDIIIDDSQHTQHAILKNLVNFLPKLNDGGCYIIEDFVADDIIFKKILDYNKKKKKKVQLFSKFTLNEIVRKLRKKEEFDHDILDLSFQRYIFLNIKKIKIYLFDNPIAGLILFERK